MRVVADTNIVVSGLLWHGKPRRVLDAARDDIIDLFASRALIDELQEVLGRDVFATRLRDANVSAQVLVPGYAALASSVDGKRIDPVVIADPDDDDVLSCAVAAQREVVTSGDHHLLDLKTYQGIRILTADQ